MNNGNYFCRPCATIHEERMTVGVNYLLEMDDNP